MIYFSQASLTGVGCNLGSPIYTITSTTVVYSCHLSYAIACVGCIA